MNYYGIDVHKKYSVYARMDERGKVLEEGRIDNTPESVAAMLEPARGNAQVVLEACGLWPYFYDLLEPQGVAVSLAHPQRVKAIAHAKVKTDKVDACTLAHLLRKDRAASEITRRELAQTLLLPSFAARRIALG